MNEIIKNTKNFSKPSSVASSISAKPNPIIVNDFSGLGVSTLEWRSTGIDEVEVHVGKPDGPLFNRSGPSGKAMTGKWVRNGMTFYLQDVSADKPLTSDNTLSTVTIQVISKKPLINLNAWSWGQIKSKLWLCNVLETLVKSNNLSTSTIWILAGWYGMLPFLLFSRENIAISKICSFDINPETEEIADAINDRWLIDNQKFKAFTEDVNNINYARPDLYFSEKPDIVINTSCEHIKELTWFNKIQEKTFVILQSTDMDDADHINRVMSIDEFKIKYPLKSTFFEDNLKMGDDNYSFTRFMIAGLK